MMPALQIATIYGPSFEGFFIFYNIIICKIVPSAAKYYLSVWLSVSLFCL